MLTTESRRPLDPDRIAALLGASGWHGPEPQLHGTLATAAGTAADLARAGAPEGACVVAEAQPAAAWPEAEVPAGGMLWAAVVVRPDRAAGRDWLPLAAALAMRDAVRAACGIPVEVEWPGDIVIPSAMCGGSGGPRRLGRVTAQEAGSAVVVDLAVAVGLSSLDLPAPGLTSVHAEGGRIDRAGILGAFLPGLRDRLAQWRAEPESLRRDYESACLTIGRLLDPVAGRTVSAVVTGVDASARLVLSTGS